MRHQQYVVNTVEVETDQCQQDASKVSELRQDVKHLQEKDNAKENQVQEVGRDVARRSRRSKARDDHDLRTSRWQEDKVHETVGLDETSTLNETRAARAVFAIDSAKDKVQDETGDP